MIITLTDNQVKQFIEDEWIDIHIGDYQMYMELNPDDSMWYWEMKQKGKRESSFAFDVSDLEKLKAKRPNDPSYYHNDPLCPSCGTYMIYQFEHCPKCGQKLDYSNK